MKGAIAQTLGASGLAVLLNLGCGSTGLEADQGGGGDGKSSHKQPEVAGAPTGAGNEVGAGGRCGTHAGFGSQLEVSTLGPSEGGPFDGPAVVERSTSADISLYFEQLSPNDSAAVVRRMKLTGLNPMPRLPVGSRVWLSKDRAGAATTLPPYQRTPGFAWTLRTEEGGAVLMGAAVNSTSAAAPVSLSEREDSCSDPHPPYCFSEVEGDAQMIYESVLVEGDVPLRLEDSGSGVVMLDGRPYDVRVSASHMAVGQSTTCAADFFPANYGGLAVDVRARDWDELVAGLPQAEPLACVQGNDLAVTEFFSLLGVGASTRYEGVVTYQQKEAIASRQPFERLTFGTPDLPSLGDYGSGFSLELTPGIFREPELGAALWVSFPSLDVQSLRESEHGPLLLATASYLSMPLAGAQEQQLELALGVPVHAEERCGYVAEAGYSQEPVALWDLVVETDPPVLAKSGERTKVEIEGRDYVMWVWGEGYMSVAVFAE